MVCCALIEFHFVAITIRKFKRERNCLARSIAFVQLHSPSMFQENVSYLMQRTYGVVKLHVLIVTNQAVLTVP